MKRYVLLVVVLTIVAAACAADWMLRHARHGTASSPVEAIKAVRGEGVVDYVIHERETSGGVLVFYLQTAEDGRVATSVEFVRKVGKGWKWEHGGGRSQSDIRLNMTDEEARDAFIFRRVDLPRRFASRFRAFSAHIRRGGAPGYFQNRRERSSVRLAETGRHRGNHRQVQTVLRDLGHFATARPTGAGLGSHRFGSGGKRNSGRFFASVAVQLRGRRRRCGMTSRMPAKKQIGDLFGDLSHG